MTMRDFLVGKYHALAWLSSFVRYLENWQDVWSAFRDRRRLPPLMLRTGLVLAGGPRDDLAGLFREIFVSRSYTRDFYSPRPGDTVLDVGANIGMFTVFLRWLTPGVRVHAFEPVAHTREQLEANVRANHLADLVTVHPVAVAAGAGTITLYHGGTNGHSSVVRGRDHRPEWETVPCIDLAEALQLAGTGTIQLLKIDTEGSEVEILGRIEPAILDRVERVVVEYHGVTRPGSRDVVARALRESGFTHVEELTELPGGEIGLIRAR